MLCKEFRTDCNGGVVMMMMCQDDGSLITDACSSGNLELVKWLVGRGHLLASRTVSAVLRLLSC